MPENDISDCILKTALLLSEDLGCYRTMAKIIIVFFILLFNTFYFLFVNLDMFLIFMNRRIYYFA